MKIKLYSVYDNKSSYFNPPFAARLENEVVASFAQAVTSGQNRVWQQFPEDYCLVCIGSYDDETGECESLSSPAMIASAAQFVTKDDVNDEN